MKEVSINQSPTKKYEHNYLEQKSIKFLHFNLVSIDKILYVIVFFIFFLSVLAMINGITTKSLWTDEAIFANNLSSFPEGLFGHLAPSAPIFYFSSYVLISLLGKAEWVYRLIPCISAVLGLGIMILFLWKHFSRFISLIVIFLLATSVPLIHYAGNAHPYATDFLCSTILLVLTYQYFHRPSHVIWILWLVVSFISIGVSYPALFVITSYGALIIFYDIWKKDSTELWRKAKGFVPLIIYTLLLIIFIFQKQSSSREIVNYFSVFFPESLLPWDISKFAFLKTLQVLRYLFFYSFEFTKLQRGLVSLFMLILLLLGTARFVTKKQYLISGICWGPVLLSFIAAIIHKWPYGNNRCMLFILPIFIVFIAEGLEFVLESIKSRKLRIGISFACIILLIPLSLTFKKSFEHIGDSPEAIRSLSQAIKSEIIDSDHFFVCSGADAKFQFYFPQYINRAIFLPCTQKGVASLINKSIESRYWSRKGRFWLICTYNQIDELELMEFDLKTYYHIVKSYSFTGSKAFLFQCLDIVEERH